jgi:hypothetical protein
VNLIFFIPLHSPDGGGDLPQHHLRNVTGCGPQNGNRFHGVEVIDPLKILRDEILPGIHAAPGQEHKSHAVFQGGLEPDLHVVSVQFLQQTASPNLFQVVQIVGKIILRHKLRHIYEEGGKVLPCVTGTKSVDQGLLDRRLVAFFHVPKGDLCLHTAVGV